EVVAFADEHGMLARDGDVVEEDVAVRRAADRGPVAARDEVLPRAPAARADDERRSLGLEVVQRDRRLVAVVLRREAHRRLAAGLALDEQGAALGAVIGGFRVLEATFRAVDVAHSLASIARAALRVAPAHRQLRRNQTRSVAHSGGDAFPARIAARRS